MSSPKRDSRDRRIHTLEQEVGLLREQITALEQQWVAKELAWIERGLRLSQENEALRRRIQILTQAP
jgi:hypothetical protein